ncbi:hypothetical protein EV401DRAFT_2152152 [Pisolithus croceorrhizus]|nr:hypothetical protein EV401DRAFT_2152152 [Pisolithus croceorrhizus]
MAYKQQKKHCLFGSRNPSGHVSNSVSEQSKGPSQAPTWDVASNSGTPGNVSQGVFIGGQEQQEEVQAALIQDTQGSTNNTETGAIPAAPDSNVNATVRPISDTSNDAADPNSGASATLTPVLALGLECMMIMPHISQTVIQNLSSTYLQPFMTFSSTIATITQVHPYAMLALGILNAATQLLINQANIDGNMIDHFNTVRAVYEFLPEDDTIQNINSMKETLGKIAQVINDATRFIKNYLEMTSFWKRLGKNIMDIRSETCTRTDGYAKMLNVLMQQYQDHMVQDIHTNVHHLVEDLGLVCGKLDNLSLEGMAYAGGVSVNKTKKCLDSTRTKILMEIINGIQNTDEIVPHILQLHGQASRGKSAITHTITLWLKDTGGFGSCFCFTRDRQAEHRKEKTFTTIAHDLADYNPAFWRALADVVAKDHSLKTISDVTEQWEKLILVPLLKVLGSMIGSMVMLVDVPDESSLEGSWKHILSVLASQANDLPCNI